MWLQCVLVSACLLVAAESAGRVKRQSEPVEECLDPKNNTGSCGMILECPQLSPLVENRRVPTPAELSYLKDSVCRRTPRRILVCCPWTPDNHPNKQLLEQGHLCGTYVDQRIRGGDEVPMGKHPWMALLFYTDLLASRVLPGCGGALISQQHVLTAAHCVTNLLPQHLLTSVRLGEHDLTNDPDCRIRTDGTRVCNSPQNFGIEKVLVHESYNIPKDRDNDIALIKLDRPVVEDQFVGKICLPLGIVAQRDYTGVNMTVTGFGRLGPNRFSPASQVLMEVALPGVGHLDCREKIEAHGGTVSEDHVCAGGEHGRDSCSGDSGGPLIAPTPTGPPYSLIGIVSFGATSCGEGGIPSVNTRVSEYLNWILDRLDD